MNSWNQNQNQNNMMVGQAQFNPYNSWGVQPRMFNSPLPTYRADPIQGENAAWQFPMGPNSEIYLPDNDKDIIWWIKTDPNGNRIVTPFDVKLHQKEQPVDTQDLAARLAAVEEWINAKSNKSNAKRTNAAANAAATTATDTIG